MREALHQVMEQGQSRGRRAWARGQWGFMRTRCPCGTLTSMLPFSSRSTEPSEGEKGTEGGTAGRSGPGSRVHPRCPAPPPPPAPVSRTSAAPGPPGPDRPSPLHASPVTAALLKTLPLTFRKLWHSPRYGFGLDYGACL
ncbi:hypothetical protein AAFF_G00286150 [Aldrovandia affinis]|uniref:Uncharacterized protein n=1 Tax=Aldrovandia affinis TaxID=143900 RepID=A0AAD7X249_9TELE|nr:hypothetical protein AAFF_G00286150 [Aldrovandia affinis]